MIGESELNIGGSGLGANDHTLVSRRARRVVLSRGENRGQQITYHNVVRNLLKVGDWNGRPESWTVPLENLTRDGVDGAVVYVQDGSREKPGAMLGAAYTSLH